MFPDAEYNRLVVISSKRYLSFHPRRIYTLLFCGLVLLSSCNYPGVREAYREPSVSAVRRTLQAISQTSPTPVETVQPPIFEETSAPITETSSVPIGLTPQPEATYQMNPEIYSYVTQAGDTLDAIAKRFDVETGMIHATVLLPPKSLLPAGIELHIPNRINQDLDPIKVLQDCDVINSPASIDLDISAYIAEQGGYLNQYTENVQKVRLSGAQIIERVAVESSINPRLLLALLEQRSGWVRSSPSSQTSSLYPIGFHIVEWSGLYKELVMASTHLNGGYYGWRNGSLIQIKFSDGKVMRLDPRLNAGTVAIQNMYSRLVGRAQWQEAINGQDGLVDTFQQLFGDTWERCRRVGAILPAGLQQPLLELPFQTGLRWSLTGGPHSSWKTGSPRGALDLAPVTGEKACAVSFAWVTSPAEGLVVRSARSVVALDLDGDGYEQTGWVIIFMHIADHERVQVGTFLKTNDQIGHPSCEGGNTTGTHFHIARKYNGEWIAADGPLPFMMGGWQAYAAEKEYQGGLINGEQEVVASPVGPRTSILVR